MIYRELPVGLIAALEEASDEIARLDAVCAGAPASAGHTLWLVALSELTDGTRATFRSLVAGDADPFHEAMIPANVARWRTALSDEERRVRGGAFLSTTRFAMIVPDIATYPERARLEAVWRTSGRERPVLLRALESAAWAPTLNLGEASAALLLCAGGRTDRVRLLPFASVSRGTRTAATDSWREGDPEPWAREALAAAARRARHLREGLQAITGSPDAEAERLEGMGRAAITARRALAVLRAALAVTMPTLADELALSRPATTDALARLTDAGLARELTGCARDRVWAWEAACSVADVALPT